MSDAAISFASPSYRAAANDLTVAISPLGLVELSDEEFEMHGPRLNRYAHNWAFYLGHHWGYKREMGEPQLTFNFVRAFADYINNFTFGRGVQFRTAHQTEHIVPALLKKVWEEDNSKEQVLWELGNQGGVSGDVFVKIAWEPAEYTNDQPRVRILALNPSFCFPEWHPHDRERMLRFKMKYRFWGTTPEGTRQVFTYTEIITDEVIEEYINDELIDQRDNPLGVIPVAHITNVPVSSSPWGLSDIQDITTLNREYNEKATDVSDIINYHAAPVTIITGAKTSNLEKGPKKVWGGLPANATVFNLENGVELNGPLEYLNLIKKAMHELTGVPEGALGQIQPISNTSGVALALMYQPMMQRYNLKKIQYTKGIKQINELVLKTLAIFAPESFTYDPETAGIKEDDQADFLDIYDPLTYQTTVHWPPPLPVDVLIKLNEVQVKMQMGLESKRGALRDLDEEFPDEKLQEIFVERIADAKEEGALQLLKKQIESVILNVTGMVPDESQPAPPPPADSDGNTPPGPGPDLGTVSAPTSPDLWSAQPDEIQQLMTDIVTKAYGTKLPQRRNPDNS